MSNTKYTSPQGNWVSMNIPNILDRKATSNLVQWWEWWCANGSINRHFMNLRYGPSLWATYSTQSIADLRSTPIKSSVWHLPWGKQCNVNSDEDCLVQISLQKTTCLRMFIDGFEMFVEIDHSTFLEWFVEVICDHALGYIGIRDSASFALTLFLFIHKSGSGFIQNSHVPFVSPSTPAERCGHYLFCQSLNQLMVNSWFGARWFGFRKDPLKGIVTWVPYPDSNPKPPGPKPPIGH